MSIAYCKHLSWASSSAGADLSTYMTSRGASARRPASESTWAFIRQACKSLGSSTKAWFKLVSTNDPICLICGVSGRCGVRWGRDTARNRSCRCRRVATKWGPETAPWDGGGRSRRSPRGSGCKPRRLQISHLAARFSRTSPATPRLADPERLPIPPAHDGQSSASRRCQAPPRVMNRRAQSSGRWAGLLAYVA
jgi:hypothetical protein